jgi:hypothetical protein
VYPGILFGSDLLHTAGETLALSYSVQAVSGLRSVQLISNGTVVAEARFDGGSAAMPLEFSVKPEADCWYSLVIEDVAGQFAYTNPVWVTITD